MKDYERTVKYPSMSRMLRKDALSFKKQETEVSGVKLPPKCAPIQSCAINWLHVLSQF